ncbi:MAG: hypothetical protein U0Z44_18820 [Kouleothrix sp.]
MVELRAYLLAKPGAAEEYPFGPETLVLKAGGKIGAGSHHQHAAEHFAQVRS